MNGRRSAPRVCKRRDVTLPLLNGGGEVNVLKAHLRITVETLLRQVRGQREIERLTGVDRKTIRRLDRAASEGVGTNSPGMATGSAGADRGAEAGSPARARHSSMRTSSTASFSALVTWKWSMTRVAFGQWCVIAWV